MCRSPSLLNGRMAHIPSPHLSVGYLYHSYELSAVMSRTKTPQQLPPAPGWGLKRENATYFLNAMAHTWSHLRRSRGLYQTVPARRRLRCHPIVLRRVIPREICE